MHVGPLLLTAIIWTVPHGVYWIGRWRYPHSEPSCAGGICADPGPPPGPFHTDHWLVPIGLLVPVSFILYGVVVAFLLSRASPNWLPVLGPAARRVLPFLARTIGYLFLLTLGAVSWVAYAVFGLLP